MGGVCHVPGLGILQRGDEYIEELLVEALLDDLLKVRAQLTTVGKGIRKEPMAGGITGTHTHWHAAYLTRGCASLNIGVTMLSAHKRR